MLLMTPGITSRSIAAVVAAAILAAATLSAAESKSDAKRRANMGPPPTARIDVGALGYTPPSRFYLIARLANATLDFVDNDHLLFTFREGGLLQRMPADPKDDDDQMVHALVLDISTGKVQQEERWRMHDRQHYLWSIGGGKFLVRQRNTLYSTDSHLELHPHMRFDNGLRGVEISPDHKLMMIEFEKYGPASDGSSRPAPPLPSTTGAAPVAGGLSGPPPEHSSSTTILMMRTQDNTIIAKSEASHSVDLPLLEDGFLEVLEGKLPDQWIVMNKSFAGKTSTIAELKSACDPSITALSDTVSLAVSCPGGSSDHTVAAYSVSGALLWQSRWQSRYIWPTFEFAENGSRFAYGSLELNHAIGTMEPFGEDDVTGQPVGVFDTNTGKLNLVKTASPVLSSGHNYALSADGMRFAILREGAIEVYDLPPLEPVPVQAAKATKK